LEVPLEFRGECRWELAAWECRRARRRECLMARRRGCRF